jgi:DNA-directed RNA polymerase subunit beta'
MRYLPRKIFVKSLVILLKLPTYRKQPSFWMILKRWVSVRAFQGGLSFSINDLIIPDIKEELLDNAKGEVDEVWDSYNMGLITNNERYNQIVDIWSRVDTRITETLDS